MIATGVPRPIGGALSGEYLMEDTSLSDKFSKPLAAWRKFTLLRTASAALVLRVSGAGLGFVNGILLARLLGPSEFGIFSIALSVVNAAATFAVLGLPMLLTREAAANAEHEQWGQLRGLLRAAHRWTLLSILGLLGITTVLLLNGAFRLDDSWAVVISAMVLVVFTAFNQLRAGILRGLNWVILADIPDLFLRPMTLSLLLAGAWFMAVHVDASDALAMQLAAVGIAMAAGTWLLIAKRPEPLRAATPKRPEVSELVAALPFLGFAIISTMETQISLYLVGYLAGAGQAGLFQAANQFVGLIVLGLVAVNMPLQPRIAAAWARGDKDRAQGLLTETARIGIAIALTGGLIIFFFPKFILSLYGSGYVEAAHALQLLAIGQVFNAAAGSCAILLLMTGYQKVVMRGTMLALVIDVAVGYLMIPHFGVLGGAAASMLGMIFWNVYFAIYANKRLGLNTTILGYSVN